MEEQKMKTNKILLTTILIITMLFTTTTAYAEVTIDGIKDALNGTRQTVENAKETLIAVTTMIANTFTDIQNSDWFAEAVKKMSESGIIKGYPDGTFKPDNPVTNGEFIKLITVATTGKDVGNSQTGHWAENYYNKGIELGLFTEADILKNQLGEGIPRQVMALLIANNFKGIKVDNYDLIQDSIMDLEESRYYQHEIIKAYGLGILTGYPDGTYKPDGTLTRAESTTVINRILNESERQIPDFTEEKEQANKEAYWQDDSEYDEMVKWIEDNNRNYSKETGLCKVTGDFRIENGRVIMIESSKNDYHEWMADDSVYKGMHEDIYYAIKTYYNFVKDNKDYCLVIAGNEGYSRVTVAVKEQSNYRHFMFDIRFSGKPLHIEGEVVSYVTQEFGGLFTDEEYDSKGIEWLRERSMIGNDEYIEINRDIFKHMYGDETGSKIIDYAKEVFIQRLNLDDSSAGVANLDLEPIVIGGYNVQHSDDVGNFLFIDRPKR